MPVFPAYPQQFMPIIFLLIGGGLPIPVPFGIPLIGLVRPEHISITRRSRASIMHTATGATLDDFGEGTPTVLLQGTTGWRSSILSGLTGFKLLELLLIEQERRRRKLAAAGLDPEVVRILYLDALNVEAFEIFLHENTFEKDKQRPLLWFYRIRATAMHDLLQESIFGSEPGGGGLLASFSSIFP